MMHSAGQGPYFVLFSVSAPVWPSFMVWGRIKPEALCFCGVFLFCFVFLSIFLLTEPSLLEHLKLRVAQFQSESCKITLQLQKKSLTSANYKGQCPRCQVGPEQLGGNTKHTGIGEWRDGIFSHRKRASKEEEVSIVIWQNQHSLVMRGNTDGLGEWELCPRGCGWVS